jgi:hypothetical protein
MSFQNYKCENIANLIWKNDTAIKLIYDRSRGTIKKYHIEGLLLQLFSLGLLQFANVTVDGSGEVVIGREKPRGCMFNVEMYKNPNAYIGVDKFPHNKAREYDYNDLLKCNSLQ